MMPQGVSAIEARISAIERQFAPVPVPPTTLPNASATSTLAGAGTSFDDLFASVTSSTAAHPAFATASAHGTHSHEYNVAKTKGAAGAPAELAPFGNGTVPTDKLIPIGQSSHKLWGPAAEAFGAMEAAARRDGITIRVTDSYRSLHAQHDVAERKGIYGKGGLAAVPGTSNHGWGRSLDIDTSGGTVEWLRVNGDRFGFFEDVAGEPWHWTYRPA